MTVKRFLIRLSRIPFSNPKFFIRFRDTAMINPAEHLFRTLNFIAENGLAEKGNTIIDIGAAKGDTTLWFAKQFPKHRIIAFEPVKECFETARDKTKRISSVVVHNLALSDSSGEAVLNITRDQLASSLKKPAVHAHTPRALADKMQITRTVSVKTARLDETGEHGGVLLMKIDTQGSELQVLRGAETTMRKTLLILIELSNHSLYENGAKYYEVDEFLRTRGFELVDIYVTYRPKGRMEEFDALYRNTAI